MYCQNITKKAQEEDDYLDSNEEMRGFGERIRKG
jgi:hypothetical protein